jgi:integrase
MLKHLAAVAPPAQSVARDIEPDDDLRLSLTNIKAVESTGQDVIYWDDDLPGVGLRVKPSGVKSYLIQYRDQRGRSKRLTLGRHGVLTPAEARAKARELLAGIELHGSDPTRDRRLAREAPTVADLAGRYLLEHVDVKNKPSTRKENRRLVDTVIIPAIGKLYVGEVTREHIAQLHHDRRSTPRLANHTLSILSKMFSLAELWGMRPENTNPARRITRYAERKRERFYSDAEIQRIGEALDQAVRGSTLLPGIADAIRFLALTGRRLGEALGLRWREIDPAAGVLNLADTKTGARQHQIGAAVIAWLEARRPEDADDGWVFYGLDPGKPLSRDTIESAWSRLRERIGLADARLHDWRHTVGTYASTAGGNAFLIRDLLGHKTTAMTNRYVNREVSPLRALADQVEGRIAAALSGKTAEITTLPKGPGRRKS